MKKLGILGGMGPLATIDFYNKVVNLTAVAHESDHLHVIIDSNPHIPDRSAYILGIGEDPKASMIESLLQLESLGAEIIVMPCNTAHFFYENISMFIHTPFLNMIEETAKHIKLDHKLDLKVGLLATKGTYVSHIYENVLLHYGIEVIIPDEEVQEIIMNLIYMVKSGIDDLTFIDINRVLNYFEARGVDRLILGCTELPVAFKRLNITKNLIDPTAILAKAAILASGGNIREL